MDKPPDCSLGPFVFTSWFVNFHGILFARVSPQLQELDIYCWIKKKKKSVFGIPMELYDCRNSNNILKTPNLMNPNKIMWVTSADFSVLVVQDRGHLSSPSSC